MGTPSTARHPPAATLALWVSRARRSSLTWRRCQACRRSGRAATPRPGARRGAEERHGLWLGLSQVETPPRACIHGCKPAPGPGPTWASRRMLEVTGGSMSTIYETSHADFPAVYAVRARGATLGMMVAAYAHLAASANHVSWHGPMLVLLACPPPPVLDNRPARCGARTTRPRSGWWRRGRQRTSRWQCPRSMLPPSGEGLVRVLVEGAAARRGGRVRHAAPPSHGEPACAAPCQVMSCLPVLSPPTHCRLQRRMLLRKFWMIYFRSPHYSEQAGREAVGCAMSSRHCAAAGGHALLPGGGITISANRPISLQTLCGWGWPRSSPAFTVRA